MKLSLSLGTLIILVVSTQIAHAQCTVSRLDAVGVISCTSDRDLTIEVECLKTSKAIAGITKNILNERSVTFSIGSASWTTDLILGKRIRLAAYNKRKNEQDFYGLGHDYITIVNAMKKGREMRLTMGANEYLISLSGFTKSYKQACS